MPSSARGHVVSRLESAEFIAPSVAPHFLGEQLLLSCPVVYWEGVISNTNPPSVVLTASVQAGPNPPISPNLGPMATTLAVQMDFGVAMQLHQKLGELGRKMGWLPPVEGGRQA